MSAQPKNLNELFKFYYEYVKPLYASISSENSLPQEVLFEINAAFDHLSRKWQFKETDSDVIKQTFGHLKRSCLDIFKLKLKYTIDEYTSLIKHDLSLIDNGDFEKNLRAAVFNLKKEGAEARYYESLNKTGNISPPEAFDKWMPVYQKCLEIENLYFNNPNIDWAKNKNKSYTHKQYMIGIYTSVIGSFIFMGIFSDILKKYVLNPIICFFKQLISLF
jgi:hypothetical protein